MLYFTVGPTQEHPRMREFLAAALKEDMHSLSHRSARFAELFETTSQSVRTLLRAPDDRGVFFGGSATEWMERSVQNLSTSKTLHFVSGHFAKRFYDFSLEMGRDARMLEQQPDGSFDLSAVPAGFEPELIALTHNETSNGTQLSPESFEEVRTKFPGAMIALDVVSSAPLYPDAFNAADVLFFSVQKAFGMPAGLGVALVSPRAIERSKLLHDQKAYTGFYHSFSRLAEYAAKGNTVETPNTLGIYLLGEIARDLAAQGVPELEKQAAQKAMLFREKLAASSEYELEPIAPEYLSQTIIVAKTPGGSKPILERLKAEGFTVASGYGSKKETHIRIGNFPAHTLEDAKRLCGLL